MTAGIVSARNRDINAGPYDDFIQTDAPINRGNSGGPLFDMDGNVDRHQFGDLFADRRLGRHRLRHSLQSGARGDRQLRQFGVARRGWIGVRIQQVTDESRKAWACPPRQGALVADVTAGGPAAKAGLQNGDLVTGFDGKPVTDDRALPRIVADTPIGKTVNIDVLRKGRSRPCKITVLSWPTTPSARQAAARRRRRRRRTSPSCRSSGLSLGALDATRARQFKIAPAMCRAWW